MTQSLYEPRHLPAAPGALLRHEAPLQVRDIMSVAPVTVTPETSVHQARHLMQRCQIRHLPVLQQGRLVGMLTDRDVRLVLPSPATSLAVWELTYLLDKLTVAEVMTNFVTTVAPHVPVARAVARMLGQKISALPVVEAGRIVGMVTRTDALRACVRGHADSSRIPSVRLGP